MNEKSEKFDSVFESLADEALNKNSKSTDTWKKYKDDLEETKKILTWLPNKLKYDVMVPIGSKAFMRGKLVHTNEVLVNLGDTWFVKKSAHESLDVCDRRLAACREMLDRLEKERELLVSKKSLPAEKEAFGSDEHPEIIEYATEEEEQEWRKRHRAREREYRQKIAEMRKMQRGPIEAEEDLWNRLDELELLEELEDELNRMDDDEDCEDDSGGTEESGEDDNESTEEVMMTREKSDRECDVRTKPTDISSPKTPEVAVKSTKCKVSFTPDLDDSSDSEPLRLEIKHSDNHPVLPPFEGAINSPSDIYAFHVKNIQPKPQSILKIKKNVNEEKEWEAVRYNKNDDDIDDIGGGEESVIKTNILNSTFILPDIVARDTGGFTDMIIKTDDKTVETKSESTRKMSRFKAARMNKHQD